MTSKTLQANFDAVVTATNGSFTAKLHAPSSSSLVAFVEESLREDLSRIGVESWNRELDEIDSLRRMISDVSNPSPLTFAAT